MNKRSNNETSNQSNMITTIEQAFKATDKELYDYLMSEWKCESLYFEGIFEPKKDNCPLGPDFLGIIKNINIKGKTYVFPFCEKKLFSLSVPVGTIIEPGHCIFRLGFASKETRKKKKNPFALKLLPNSVRNTSKINSTVKKEILELDDRRKELSLLYKGEIVECRISRVECDNLIVELKENFYADVKTLPKAFVGDLTSLFTENEIVYVVVTNVDVKKSILNLSLLPDYKKRRDAKIEELCALEFVKEMLPDGKCFIATVESFSKNSVVISIGKYKGYIQKSDLSVNTVRKIDDIVFKGEIRKVMFKEHKDGKLFFSLKEIENDCYPKALYNASIDELLDTMHVKHNHFIAQLLHNKIKNDVVALNLYADKDNGELLCNPFTGKNITALNKNDDNSIFEDGLYYEIELLEPSIENVTDAMKNPYLFSFRIVNDSKPVENPYRRAVEKNFKKFSDPKSNLSLSGLLDEVGMNMYSSRKRMFFELLQNADDASALNGVQMKIAVLDNYLIITHNGFAFNRNDFEAITSASNSNKRQNSQKTGYKGIGFKSVFTNSKKVFIKTGGFFFVFDKFSPEFQDFKSFYFKARNLVTEESQAEFLDDYNLEYINFKKEKHIPWHLLPLWCDAIPEELTNTIFKSGSQNVAIALNMDEVSTEDYRNIILEILHNPRFMLFLRNTKRIQYIDEHKNVISIGKVLKEGAITLKNSFSDEDKTSDFLVDEEVGSIPITDNDLLESNVPFRREKDGDRVYFVEDTEKGPKELDSIPDRIASSNKTVISFALSLDSDGKFIIGSGKENSLYAYLPMNESRFRFPFYVNADFVLSSDREGVKDENLWNQFLFKKIGEKLPLWVAKIASPEQPNYLNVLSAELDDEIEGAKNLASNFNAAYKNRLITERYILNYKNELCSLEEIAIDKSGLSKIIGEDLFCMLVNTSRTLPHPNCDITILKTEMFAGFKKIEYIESNEVIRELSTASNLKYIRHWFDTASSEKREAAFSWIMKKYSESSTTTRYYLYENMPVVLVGGHYRTLNEIKNNSNIVLANHIFNSINETLTKLRFVCSENVSNHSIVSFVTSQNTWKDYCKNIFTVIESRTSIDNILDVDSKYILFTHFSSKDIMASIGLVDSELSHWRLFTNANGDIRPLYNMIHVSEDTYRDILAEYIIAENEYRDDIIGKYVIAGKDYYRRLIFDNWDSLSESIVRTHQHALLLYSLASTTYDAAILEKARAVAFSEEKPNEERNLIWINDSYKKKSECFCNNSASTYEAYGAVIKKISNLNIPSLDVLGAVNKAPFSIASQKLSNIALACETPLSYEDVKYLLGFCKLNQDTVFDNYYIIKEKDAYYFKALGKGSFVAYSSNDVVFDLITKYCPQIHMLQKEFAVFSEIADVCTGDDLKRSMLKSISKFTLTKDYFVSKEDDVYKWIYVVSSISENLSEALIEMRNKFYYRDENSKEYLLSSFKLQQDITFEKKKYPLSALKPSDNTNVRSINILIDRLRKLEIKETAIKILFNLSEQDGLENTVFAELNKANHILQNGTQLAFILSYANKTNSSIYCKLQGGTAIANTKWYSTNYSFLKEIHQIPLEYSDILEYFTIPFDSSQLKFSIIDIINDYSHIKNTLDDGEIIELLDYIFNKWSKDNNTQLNDVNRDYVNSAVGLSPAINILSKTYALKDEMLPSSIQKWIESEPTATGQKLIFVKDVLHISDDESEVVIFRKYISGISDIILPAIKDVNYVTEKTLKWIVNKSLSLDPETYISLMSVFTTGSFEDKIDIETLKTKINLSLPEYESETIKYYSYNGEMLHVVTIPNYNNYKCFSYKKGNAVYVDGMVIYNDNIDKELTNIVLEEILNKYGEYTSDDFTELYQLIRKDHAQFDTGVDDGLSEESKAAMSEIAMKKAMQWLKDHNYDISEAVGEYSLYTGVKNAEGVEIPIVVKSCRSKDRHFELSPYQWMHLMKVNSVLMLYRGGDELYITSRDELLEGKDRISLTFDIQNLDTDNRISSLAHTLSGMHFMSVQFDFGKIKPSQYHIADKLENYHFNSADFKFRPDVTEGQDSDID